MRRTSLYLSTAVWLAACGTDVSGPPASLYSCLFLEPATLGVGEAVTFQGTGHRGVCLTTTDADAAFVYVPFFGPAGAGSESSALAIGVEVMGAGVTAPVAASPAGVGATGVGPDAGAHGLRNGPLLARDVAAHRRLRQREIVELGPKIRAGVATGTPPVAAAVVAAQEVGELVEYNVATSCTAEDMRTGRVTYVSDHAVVVADIQNPAGFGPQDYQHFALSFDTLVHPVAVRHFGAPSDVDGNGRTVIFFTRSVNERTPPGASTFTAALFWAGDLFPATATPRLDACPGGNQAEIFYLAVPDPNGLIGPQVSLANLREQGVHIIGHEYQHLINAGRRLYVNNAPVFEQTWLNEGLSHIAEELLFFEVSGLPRGANITGSMLLDSPGAGPAFNRYMASNVSNLTRYLERPDTATLMGVDNLTTRGAAWSFLRYAADRRAMGDESFFFDLANSTRAGLDNLNDALQASALDWLQDWTVALMADDLVANLEPRFRQPSWNFRDIYPTRLGRTYPLATAALATGAPRSLSLQAGSTAYLTFGIAPDHRAALHIESDGRSPPHSLRGTFLRVR